MLATPHQQWIRVLLKRPLDETLLWPEARRTAAALGVMAFVSLAVLWAPLAGPIGGTLSFVVLLAAAWFGGTGAGLLLPPLLLVLTRLSPGKTWQVTSSELLALGIISLITIALGLAGQFRRRVRTVSEMHVQTLRDQQRALNLAFLVFRNLEGRVTDWTAGAERLFGWTPYEAIGLDLHELLRTRLPRSRDAIQQELLAAGHWEGELVHKCRDGRELIVASQWTLLRDPQGEPTGVVEVYNDISDLRRAEATIREADEKKTVFLAMLAHELRNPMAPICSGLELMKLGINDPAEFEEIRETMERQTRQLIALLDDLLDISRMTLGKLGLRKQRVRLREVIHTAIESARHRIDAAGHDLEVCLPEGDPLIEVDPHRLSQIVTNLLHNAAKYTPDPGQIRLAAACHGRDLVVSVQDSGIGIPEEQREFVFTMFSQLGREMHRGDSGLGIGLTLANYLAELHGGRIDIGSNAPDPGSIFHVHLPQSVILPVPSEPSSSTTEAVDASGRRVLVVDDNAAAAKMLSLVMTSLGYDVRIAHDGIRALDVAFDYRPDLVLMDLGMPGLNGYETARKLRQESWGQNMFLIAVSGWGREEDKQQSREAGFDFHLTKPTGLDQLKQLLSQLELGPA